MRRLHDQSLPPLLCPLLTQPTLLRPLRRAFLMIPQTPTYPTKLQQGDHGIRPPQMRRIRPTRPALNHTTNLNPRRRVPPDVGKAVEAVREHELERCCHFPIIFFTPPQKFHITSIHFQHVPYSLTFSCQLHTFYTSHILSLPFRLPIPCKIVINSLYPFTLVSGIHYF